MWMEETVMKRHMIQLYEDVYQELIKLGDASETPNDIVKRLIEKEISRK